MKGYAVTVIKWNILFPKSDEPLFLYLSYRPEAFYKFKVRRDWECEFPKTAAGPRLQARNSTAG